MQAIRALDLVRRLLPPLRARDDQHTLSGILWARSWRDREARAEGVDCAICAHHARRPTTPLLPHVFRSEVHG